MGYRSDYVGDENYKLSFVHLNADRTSFEESEKIEQVSAYTFHESASSESNPIGVFYTVRNEMLRPTKLFYHKFGTSVTDDVLIYESTNDMFTVGVGKSSDREYILIDYHSKTENEIYSISMVDSLKIVKEKSDKLTKEDFIYNSVRPLQNDIEYSANHGGGAWWLKTKEGCKKEHFRVLRKKDNTDKDFIVFLEEDSEFAIQSGLMLTKNHVGLHYISTKTGQPKLLVYKTEAESGISSKPSQVYFPNVDPVY